MNKPEVAKRVGNAYLIAYLLGDFQTPLKVLKRLRVAALQIVNIPDVVKRVGNAYAYRLSPL